MKLVQLLAATTVTAIIALLLLSDRVVTVVASFRFAQQQFRHQQCIQTIRMRYYKIIPMRHQNQFVTVILSHGNEDDDRCAANELPDSSELSSSSTTTLIAKPFTKTPKQMKNSGGVYVRPSAAIERGSGFFVPGLEGYKVRLFVGSIVVLLTVVLHFTNDVTTDGGDVRGNDFAETLALFYGLLVLLQGSIEARKDNLIVSNYRNNASSMMKNSSKGVQVVYQQQWFMEIPDTEWRQTVEWVASTYLSLTSATEIILIGPGKIIFSLGTNARPSRTNYDDDDDDEYRGCNGALATLAQSTSGCLSLPMNHITVQTLVLPSSSTSSSTLRASDRIDDNDDEMARNLSVPRSVVLQQINDQLCWMMVSNQLLASFTTNDLQWLGQLAQYTNPE